MPSCARRDESAGAGRQQPQEAAQGWRRMAAKARRAGPGKERATLYVMSMSHHCVKAWKVLDRKGVAYDRVEVPYHDKRALLKATGQDYVPWLQWGDRGIPWHQLVDAVEEAVPEPTLFPGGNPGAHRIVEQWAHDVLEEVAWRVAVPDVGARFKDEVERWVFEEMQERKRGSLEAYRKRRPEFEADLAKHLAHVEASLDGRDFLLGDEPGLADFAVFGATEPLAYVGLDVPKAFPRTRAWRQRVAKV